MRNISYITLMLLLLVNPLYADGKLEYEAIQATFLSADDAIVYQEDEGVVIQTVGLKPGQKSGVVLVFDNLEDPEIEVTTLVEFNGMTVGLYPPKNMKPNDKGVYNVLGNKGDRFGIRARTKEGLQQIYVVVEGVTTDPENPPDSPPTDPPAEQPTPIDIQTLVSIGQKASAELADPITARYIKEALTTLSLSEVVEVSKIKEVIGKALLSSMKEVNPPYKDWNGVFRVPLNTKLSSMVTENKLSSTANVKLAIDALIKGLTTTSTNVLSKVKNGTITMYTRPGCIYCERWKKEIRPQLHEWKVEEVLDLTHAVPRFQVCDNNKCSKIHEGFMDINDFIKIVDSLKEPK